MEGKDLDNLAHSILVPFEEQLCARRGTVVAYRAYEADGVPRGVQVRVLDQGRFLMLQAALGEAHGKPTLEQRLERKLDDWNLRLGDWSSQQAPRQGGTSRGA